MFMSQKEYDILELTSETFTSDKYKKHIELSGAELTKRKAILEDLSPAVVAEVVQEASDEQVANGQEDESTIVIKKARKNGHISVGTQKLDQLINIVSELVIFRSELQHLMGEVKSPAIVEAMEKLERYTLRLRDSAFGIRLVPLNILNVK